jgi:hypothetical protein
MTGGLTKAQRVMIRLGQDRPLAHRVLFAHRHPNRSPPFHRELILDWHSSEMSVLDMVFRGGAKSTIAEEAIVVKALYREFRNCLIVGSDSERAAERLKAIAHELDYNEHILKLWGSLRGETWAPDSGEIILSTGIKIQSLGRGQSLRGIKFLDTRPDLLFADDLEEYADVVRPEGRKKIHDWFDGELIPALEPGFMARMAATPMHPEALPFHVMKDPTWKCHRFPIKHRDPDTGEWASSWPERFPMTEAEAVAIRRAAKRAGGKAKVRSIEDIEGGLARKGQVHLFNCEYMCEADSPETKPFKREMFWTEPQVRTWQAVYTMTDPARTTGARSATTGFVAWSWIGARLVVWDAWGRRLMPDEIIAAQFAAYEEHHPVWMGFEEDGLNQWALQPFRQEMAKRGILLPFKAVKAPPGKTEFIRGLQPFFTAREVRFAKPLPDLEQQLLGFPSGDIDVPNALAYALKLRPGAPLYTDFGAKHVADQIEPTSGRPLTVCLNATRSMVSAVALQVFDGCLRVYRDYVREGEPAAVLAGLISDIQADSATRDLQFAAGPSHWDRYNNVGLIQACTRIPIRSVHTGLPPEMGRPRLTSLLQRDKGGMPMVMVSDKARWTLNAFAGGYSRVLLKQGQLADYAEDGPYRVLMEGLESYVALTELGSTDGYGQVMFNAETAEGRPYHSLLGSARTVTATKADW